VRITSRPRWVPSRIEPGAPSRPAACPRPISRPAAPARRPPGPGHRDSSRRRRPAVPAAHEQAASAATTAGALEAWSTVAGEPDIRRSSQPPRRGSWTSFAQVRGVDKLDAHSPAWPARLATRCTRRSKNTPTVAMRTQSCVLSSVRA
jgi:hypothetical protein